MKFAEKSWYQRSPIAAQNLVVSFYGMAGRLVRNGEEFRRILDELEESEWYSGDQFQALQDEKLRALIEHSYEYVPFYREAMEQRGLTPADIATTADLTKLPYVTKEDVRTRMNDFLSTAPERGRLYPSSSSGTTGTPLELIRDQYSVSFEQASLWRHWRIAGVGLWDRRATLRGHPVVPQRQTRPPYWRVNGAENQLIMSGFHLSDERARDFADAIRSFGAVALEAIPSPAYFLARAMLEQGIRLDLRCVVTGSEPLYPEHRPVIEEAFGCKVFDFYGQSERVCFGMECERHTGLHLAPEYGVVEYREPEWDHDEGVVEVIGTGLNNFKMPLIRYRTEDFISSHPEPCPCGRAMPLLPPLDTRAGGILRTPDGRNIAYSLVNYAFMGTKNFRKTQLIQDELDRIRVKIVPADEYTDEDGRHLVEKLTSYLGEDVTITLEIVDDIARSRSGKYQWIVSNLDPLR